MQTLGLTSPATGKVTWEITSSRLIYGLGGVGGAMSNLPSSPPHKPLQVAPPGSLQDTKQLGEGGEGRERGLAQPWRTWRVLSAMESSILAPLMLVNVWEEVLLGLPPSARSAFSWRSGTACSFSVVEGGSTALHGTSGPCVSCRLLPPPVPPARGWPWEGRGPGGGPPRLRQNLRLGCRGKGCCPLGGRCRGLAADRGQL